jgi:Tol biopolymer transport system component
VLACATPAPAQEPGRPPSCSAALPDPWRCVGAPRPANAFEPLQAFPSPEGTRFVYARAEGENRQLWLWDVRTGTARRLTHARGRREDPVWSPDGSRIAFTMHVPWRRSHATAVGVVDAATGEERLIAAEPSSGRIGSVSWTPRGRVLFHVWESPPSFSAHGDRVPEDPRFPSGLSGGWWTMDADGRDPVRLRLASGDWAVFSPAGDSMASIGSGCSRRGESGVWIVDPEKGGEGRCIQSLPQAGWHARLAWPHADTLLYLGPVADDSAFRAYLLPRDGTPARRLDVGEAEVTGVGVSRDGTVALSLYHQRARIALLPAGGGVPVPLPDVPDGIWPEWHPSGLELAFTAVPRRPGWSWHQASFVRTAVPPRIAGARPVQLSEPRPSGPPSYGPPGTTPTTSLTGTWSRDGRYIAIYTAIGISAEYRVARNDTLDVLAAYADSGGVGGPAVWSPDGSRLLLATGHLRYGERAEQPPWSLMWVEMDSILRVPRGGYTRNFRPVPLEGFAGRAVWPRPSPDGAWIAFATHPGADQRGGVYVVPAQGGVVRAVAEFPAGRMLTGPEWTAGGDSIYFSSPDASGVYQLRRVWRGGGAAETLTAGAEHVLHPRLAPDGRTLAVTLLDVRTELWTLPGRFRAFPGRAAPTAYDPVEPVDPARISARLLEMVQAAEARSGELRRLWPGFWDERRTYGVHTGHAETAEALIVSPRGETPPPGFAPVDAARMPAGLRGRLYHARGPASGGNPETELIPMVYVPVDPASEEEALIAALRPPAEEDPRELRVQLRTLFGAVLDSVGIARFSQAADPGCPTHDPRSCAVQARAERVLLQRALHARGGPMRELLRDYAALAWMRGGGNVPGDLWWARTHGIHRYVATLGAYTAMGTGADGYPADVTARLADTTMPSRGPAPVHIATGEAVALLLDRVDASWRERVAGGEPLLDALFHAIGLSPAAALARAPAALRRSGVPALPAALPAPAESGPAVPLRQTFYLTALRSLAPGTPAILIDLQTDRSPGGNFQMEYDAGPAGAAVPAAGFVLLPDPAWVRVRAGDVAMEVRGHPVALIRTPGITSDHVRVVVYPRIDLDYEVWSADSGEGRGQHVRAEGLDLRIGPDADVCSCAEIYIRPAP